MNLSQKIKIILGILIVPVLAATCSDQEVDDSVNDSFFTGPFNMGRVEFDEIDEASGLAVSRVNKNMLWTHNDSGDDARIFLMTDSARHVGQFYLKGAKWRDAEDIAIGPGPVESVSYIYLGDIGDNWARNEIKQIYRFPEPDVSGRKTPFTDTIANYDVIHYRFPDRIRDAETLMIDPNTKDLYVVSKREINVVMYKMAYPYSPNDTITMEIVGNLPLSIIVAGDISSDGTEVLLKSYNEIYYYKLKAGEGIESIIHKQPERLPYAIEPQGEAIAWNTDASGYYTVSEEVLMIPAVLYYYQRMEEQQKIK
jgi:hypothetical protein